MQERSCALLVTVKVPMGVEEPTRRACNINPSNLSPDWLLKNTEEEKSGTSLHTVHFRLLSIVTQHNLIINYKSM